MHTVPPPTIGLWLPTYTLWQREMVRFFRQRNRVIGALATPIVFWLVLGSGLNRSFVREMPLGRDASGAAATHTAGYLEYFFPGTVILILLFTAVFSTISVIEDRREGFLQGVLVSPIPREAFVLGKVLGGATIATLQGLAVLLLWPLVGHWSAHTNAIVVLLSSLAVMFTVATWLTGLGLCIAWPMDSTAGFHAILNLFLMPMWFLSGAVFPVDTVPGPMRALMLCNPLTYGQAAFVACLSGGAATTGVPVPPWGSLAITLGVTAVVLATAVRLVARPRSDGLA